ncbi:helix-turn-helix transcriptional regulator [Rhodoplanes sp. TEM]|uniref:Helix-turn-helix transcriptional regulator n=1 Tax=Rhodoplanes tepidamans TaxID=200616 RepID=A0ABT5JHS1_RHOTP|nr:MULTISPECIES: helix-turn-helix transcriptional regulator [Rhodoplanes]MDC7789270.1 helix-turn-helix transcriptional regulator [Rhodoplanes tepidamans]MDC7987049.1 helix-turn-helix transcriptional regulator [Rhodoplanes sp. TEM]MDQ0355539.1 putative XRE-type DNA-binding protein [Rhodoplanes tepidamans]
MTTKHPRAEPLEVVRGSGNAFADVGLPNADAELIKSRLAAELIQVMREKKLTAAAVHRATGVTVADISRIRNADLGRFSIDRLVRLLNGLGRRVGVTVEPAQGRSGAVQALP